MHASYAARWGIDMAGVEPSSATLAYTDFLLGDRRDGRAGDGVRGDDSVHAPVRMAGRGLDAGAAGPYAEWVQTYADPGFEALASRLERLLDEHADDSPAVQRPTGGRCTSRWRSSTPHCHAEEAQSPDSGIPMPSR